MDTRPTPDQIEPHPRDGPPPPDAASATGAGASTEGTPAYRPIVAVMVLGVGAVMVASVFPGRTDVSGEALRSRIAAAAIETAVETLKLSVPVLAPGLDGNPADTHARVLFPKALVSPFDLISAAVEREASIEPGAEVDLYRASPYPVPAAGEVIAPPSEWLRLSRMFTEMSGWDAEIVLHAGAAPDLVRTCTWVTPSQNLLADSGEIVADRAAYIDLGVESAPAPLRVHLLDRVYPPGGLRYSYAKEVCTEPDRHDLRAAPRVLAPSDLLERLAGERHAWHAIHGLSPRHETTGGLLCTIVVTERDTREARFARQADPVDGDLRFDLRDPDGADARVLRVPQTAGAALDTVFPQAWLVMLDDVVPETGTVVCTRAIARMLPVGSYFFIARTAAAGAPAGFETGTAHKVIGGTYKPGAGTPSAVVTLRVARTSGGPMGRTAVWVFPPPIRSHRGPWFASRSPVIGIGVEEVMSDE